MNQIFFFFKAWIILCLLHLRQMDQNLVFTPVHCVRPIQSVKPGQSNMEIFNFKTKFFIFILQGLYNMSFLIMTCGGGESLFLGCGVFNIGINWNLCQKLLELVPAESSA